MGCVAAKLPGDRKKDKSSQLEGHLPGMLRLLVKNLTAPLTMDTEQSLKVRSGPYAEGLPRSAVTAATTPSLTRRCHRIAAVGFLLPRRGARVQLIQDSVR